MTFLRACSSSALIGSLRYLPFVQQGSSFRALLLQLAGVRIDGYAAVFGAQLIVYPEKLSIGRDASINAECTFEGSGGITIGRKARLGPRVIILTTNHIGPDLDTQERKPVIIGADSWIGAGSIIVPGITIGERGVVGAGSVVTRDVAPGVRVAGNPAKPIRSANGEHASGADPYVQAIEIRGIRGDLLL